jgi:phage repressor protein C with HTH and peptisase S24 domain
MVLKNTKAKTNGHGGSSHDMYRAAIASLLYALGQSHCRCQELEREIKRVDKTAASTSDSGTKDKIEPPETSQSQLEPDDNVLLERLLSNANKPLHQNTPSPKKRLKTTRKKHRNSSTNTEGSTKDEDIEHVAEILNSSAGSSVIFGHHNHVRRHGRHHH